MIRRALPLLLLPLLGAGCHAVPASAQAASAPMDIEYRMITRFPTCRGNERTRVDAVGRVWKAQNLTDCAPGEKWSTPYPAAPLRTLSPRQRARLEETVEKEKFFELAPRHTDPNKVTSDGYVEEIEVNQGGRRHQVAAENGYMPAAFRKLRQLLIDAGS